MNININLSEETRAGTILILTTCYDLHIIKPNYYICEHGTYNVLACMTKKIL